MRNTIKAGLVGLSMIFCQQAAAEENVTIDLTKLNGFEKYAGDLLQHENENFDLSTARFYKLADNEEGLPVFFCGDIDGDNRISSDEQYRYNVRYSSMLFSVDGVRDVYQLPKGRGSDQDYAVIGKEIMKKVDGLEWAVFLEKDGDPLLIAVNTDQGLMVRSAINYKATGLAGQPVVRALACQ